MNSWDPKLEKFFDFFSFSGNGISLCLLDKIWELFSDEDDLKFSLRGVVSPREADEPKTTGATPGVGVCGTLPANL